MIVLRFAAGFNIRCFGPIVGGGLQTCIGRYMTHC
ncbi:Uncharacterised protein [Mycobacteroides abscessus subsp. abscessus]|nr:Uncharacterised protein [Mycobacteroides abscessus subsp. abscessus]